jgi:hypothetical protein
MVLVTLTVTPAAAAVVAGAVTSMRVLDSHSTVAAANVPNRTCVMSFAPSRLPLSVTVPPPTSGPLPGTTLVMEGATV